MSVGSSFPDDHRHAVTRGDIGHRIDAAAWALFFVWAGTSILANIRWGWFLVGVGAIVLAAEVALHLASEKIDGFWIACGIALLAAGAWELLSLTWPLLPVLLILLGAGTLWRALFGTFTS